MNHKLNQKDLKKNLNNLENYSNENEINYGKNIELKGNTNKFKESTNILENIYIIKVKEKNDMNFETSEEILCKIIFDKLEIKYNIIEHSCYSDFNNFKMPLIDDFSLLGKLPVIYVAGNLISNKYIHEFMLLLINKYNDVFLDLSKISLFDIAKQECNDNNNGKKLLVQSKLNNKGITKDVNNNNSKYYIDKNYFSEFKLLEGKLIKIIKEVLLLGKHYLKYLNIKEYNQDIEYNSSLSLNYRNIILKDISSVMLYGSFNKNFLINNKFESNSSKYITNKQLSSYSIINCYSRLLDIKYELEEIVMYYLKLYEINSNINKEQTKDNMNYKLYEVALYYSNYVHLLVYSFLKEDEYFFNSRKKVFYLYDNKNNNQSLENDKFLCLSKYNQNLLKQIDDYMNLANKNIIQENKTISNNFKNKIIKFQLNESFYKDIIFSNYKIYLDPTKLLKNKKEENITEIQTKGNTTHNLITLSLFCSFALLIYYISSKKSI